MGTFTNLWSLSWMLPHSFTKSPSITGEKLYSDAPFVPLIAAFSFSNGTSRRHCSESTVLEQFTLAVRSSYRL